MGGIDGRALHLLDVEYLGCRPTLSAGDHELCDLARLIHDLGVEVWAAAYAFDLGPIAGRGGEAPEPGIGALRAGSVVVKAGERGTRPCR